MFKRINKTQARKRFAARLPFFIVGAKVSPAHIVGGWGLGFLVGEREYNDPEVSFDRLINNWAYYNANNELGYYPAFYVK